MPPETTVKHRRLRAHVDAYRCCVKSLVWSALVGFDVRQHARAESISKRAPSTTRKSLPSTRCARSGQAGLSGINSLPWGGDPLKVEPCRDCDVRGSANFRRKR